MAHGMVNEVFNVAATFPLDLVKRRMQLQGAAGKASVCKPTITGTIREVFQKEGLRGFYRGIAPEYLKVVPSVGIAFMTYETLKIMLSS
jgi:solute carrier family 25 (mitochondrial phosphate transporter), member 23/24/25/41